MICVAEGVYVCMSIVDVSFCAYWEHKLKFIILGPENMEQCQPWLRWLDLTLLQEVLQGKMSFP